MEFYKNWKDIFLTLYHKYFKGALLIIISGILATLLDKNTIAGIIIISYVILFIIIYFLGSRLLYKDNEIKEIIHSSPKKVIRHLGYSCELMEIQFDIGIGGNVEILFTYHIVSSMENLFSVLHEFSTYGGIFDNPEINLEKWQTRSGSKIFFKIGHKNKRHITYHVIFNPPLQRNRKAEYIIREKYGPALFLMTREEIEGRVKEGKWQAKEPVEFVRGDIIVPTKELILRAIFPQNYPVYKYKKEDFFDVLYIGTLNRNEEEYKCLQKDGNCFTREEEGGRQILELRKNNPEPLLEYRLKWQPPTKVELYKITGNK